MNNANEASHATNPPRSLNYYDLPCWNLNYDDGVFINNLTGELLHEVYGVVLGYREDRVLWPSEGETPRYPLCVNGSEYGPCLCPFADYDGQNNAPDCSEELTLLMWDDEHQQVTTLTARRTQARVLLRWLSNKALVSGVLHDQQVTIGMRLDGELHRLTIRVERNLGADSEARMAAVAQRGRAAGFEGL